MALTRADVLSRQGVAVRHSGPWWLTVHFLTLRWLSILGAQCASLACVNLNIACTKYSTIDATCPSGKERGPVLALCIHPAILLPSQTHQPKTSIGFDGMSSDRPLQANEAEVSCGVGMFRAMSLISGYAVIGYVVSIERRS